MKTIRKMQSERSTVIGRRRKGLVAVVIPTYRASRTIARVIAKALLVADHLIVVDDGCPEHSGQYVQETCSDARITVIYHEMNRGVGAATKTGITEAIRLGADFIVKIDADDQMDTTYVPHMLDILRQYTDVDLVKGNRFGDPTTLRTMPVIRLVGNAALTLLVKISSGYWTIVDPTNGFIAVRSSVLRAAGLAGLANRYFFEIDLLCWLGLSRRGIAELEMPAIYGDERSSLVIARVLLDFPLMLAARLLRRLLLNYVIVEINAASLYGIIGLPLLLFGTFFGAHEWAASLAEGVPRPTGTIILALLLFMLGFQLSLQALIYDVQFSARTIKLRRDPESDPRDTERFAQPEKTRINDDVRGA